MDYPIPVRIEVSETEAADMAARRQAAGVSVEEANEERRKIGANKTLQEIFRSGVDVTAYGVFVPHWTRGTRR